MATVLRTDTRNSPCSCEITGFPFPHACRAPRAGCPSRWLKRLQAVADASSLAMSHRHAAAGRKLKRTSRIAPDLARPSFARSSPPLSIIPIAGRGGNRTADSTSSTTMSPSSTQASRSASPRGRIPSDAKHRCRLLQVVSHRSPAQLFNDNHAGYTPLTRGHAVIVRYLG